MTTLGTFECQNCGRSREKTHPKQKFCPRMPGGPSCKDRYWSRGTRRVSKMNIQIGEILNVLRVTVETSALLLGRIEKLEEQIKIHREIEHDDIEEDSTTEMSEDEIFELTGIRPLKPGDRD